MKNLILLLILILSVFSLRAQDLDPVKWTYKAQEKDKLMFITFTAEIQEGWYLYAQDIPKGGPIPTSFHFETDNSVTFEVFAEESSDHLVAKYDEMFAMDLKKYKNQVVFTYTPEVDKEIKTIKGYLEFMCCDDLQCLPPKIIEFSLNLK